MFKRLLFLALFLPSITLAQPEGMQLPKFLPPPPDAFQITKGAEFSPSLNYGTGNISIPLFEMKAGSSKIPFVLNYSSNGVMVDDVPSKTGVNWSFNPAGVISRTVMDEDDDNFPLLTPPADPNDGAQMAAYLYPMLLPNSTGNYNTQPDEYRFNFNGHSGKFFYDHTGEVHLTTYSKIIIEKNNNSTTWKFKITDENGVKYYFGGSSATEKSKYSNLGCPRVMFNTFTEVAWHLIKVEYPNGDEISFHYGAYTFSYPSSVSQSFMIKGSFGTLPSEQTLWGGFPSIPSSNTCQSILSTKGVYLQNISCNNGESVHLTYIAREDLPGEKALHQVIHSFNGKPVNRFKFYYEYSNSGGNYEAAHYNQPLIQFGRKRLFLKEVVNLGYAGSRVLSTKFDYEDINGLPPRLSAAQDHFGYFNGKNNAFYVPLETDPSPYTVNTSNYTQALAAKFNTTFNTTITADKEPDFNFAQKGILRKITYPTKGETELQWEGNTVNKDITIYPASINTTASAVGSCMGPSTSCHVTTNTYFTISYTQLITIDAEAGMVIGEDPIHSSFMITIYNTAGGIAYPTKTLKFNNSLLENINIGPGTYRMELVSTSSDIPGSATLSYRPGSPTGGNYNIPVPGLRIKKVMNDNKAGNITEKNYYYYKFDDPSKSTGNLITTSYYELLTYNVNKGGFWQPGNIPYIDGYITNTYHKIQGSSHYRGHFNSTNNINYSHVVEAEGNNFDNGAIEHNYFTSYNSPGQVWVGDRIKFGAFADNAFMDGLELETKYFEKRNGQLELLKKVQNNYTSDNRRFSWYDGYVVQSKNSSSFSYQPSQSTDPSILNSFDVMKYPRYSSWVHPFNVIEHNYDPNGEVMTTEKSFNYENPDNLSPGSEVFYGSDGNPKVTLYKYITDYASMTGLSANTIAAASQMLNANIVTPLLEKQTLTNEGSPLYTTRTEYKIWPNSQALPEFISDAKFNNDMEERIRFHNYDAKGNAVELSKKYDAQITYIWGYNDLYPVAEIKNASKEQVYYTSFEEDALAVEDANSKTGGKVMLNSFTANFTKPNTKDYIISYHTWDGVKWNYAEQDYTGTSYTITAAKIDEVRIFPKEKTEMVTYTYNARGLVSSTCSPNGLVTYYEYDTFNRLTLARDNDRNVLKKYCYNYAGQLEDCTQPCTNTDPFWQNTAQVPQCQFSNCAYTGYLEQEQMDINDCSPSFGETRWVPAGYNPSACTNASVANISYLNNLNEAGFTAVYTSTTTGQFYSFNIPASGTGNLGCIPTGKYNLTISKPGNYMMHQFGSLCSTMAGSSATIFVNVSVSMCNGVTIDPYSE